MTRRDGWYVKVRRSDKDFSVDIDQLALHEKDTLVQLFIKDFFCSVTIPPEEISSILQRRQHTFEQGL